MLKLTELTGREIRVEGIQTWNQPAFDQVLANFVDKHKAEEIGSGGFGTVLTVPCPPNGRPTAIKLFKPQGNAANQLKYSETLQLKFKKQPTPVNGELDGVIWPRHLLTILDSGSGSTQVIGYTMRLLKGVKSMSDLLRVDWRNKNYVSNNVIVNLLKIVHQTISELHHLGIVLGDIKPENHLVSKRMAYRVDVDAFGYPGIPAEQYSIEYLMPEYAVASGSQLRRTTTLSTDSDWYAFTIMAWQCLMLYHPVRDGSFPHGHAAYNLPVAHRGLHDLSALSPEVKLPNRLPPEGIGDQTLAYFKRVFHDRQRGVFPKEILDRMTWRRCRVCRSQFASKSCPICARSKRA